MTDSSPVRLTAPTRHGCEVTIDPRSGGRLTSLRVDGVEVLGGPFASDGGVDPAVPHGFGPGSFPMAPYAGRIRDGVLALDTEVVGLPLSLTPHAGHGLVHDIGWALDDVGASAVSLSVDIPAPWAWRARASQQVHIDDHGVDISLTVDRLDDSGPGLMPVWVGQHPWFRRFVDVPGSGAGAVEFGADSMWERDSGGLPTGSVVAVPDGPWDDCFEGVGDVVVRWPGGPQLLLTASTQTWVFFTQRPESFCAEPQTAPPNAKNIGRAHWLDAGEQHRLSMRIAWEPTDHA